MRVVVAVGGNALIQRGDKPDAGIQLQHIDTAARSLASLASAQELLICHGNGPQIGLLAIESEADESLSRPYPLDVLGAQTQGMIGYWLTQALSNAGVSRPAVSLITQVVVDGDDPAFAAPSKLVGPGYSASHAQELADQHGWSIAQDGDRWRRVVPSPQPRRIVELATIRRLVDLRSLVICGGGGGAPVVDDGTGQLRGVEAVVDKDLTAAMLAADVYADRLLILTDVSAVMRDFGTPKAKALPRLTLADLAHMRFPAGSMAPKIEACRRFVAATGHSAAIGSPSEAAAVLAGTAGTTITAR